jgi:glutamyl-tRNA(Gln) amidotransferase subunit D
MIRDLNKPVVLTYSQRSSDRGSSDSELNLYCAAKAALSDIAEVMLVGHANSDDDFCYALPGTKTRKMHTSRRDTFKAINSSPIAKITRDKIEILRNYNKRNKNQAKLDDSFEPNVALIKFYPGQDPEILNWHAKNGYRGIVIEMSGLGHVLTEGSRNWVPVIKELVKKGITVCAAPQTLYGRLDPLVYSPGRELEKAGVIYLKDILPETAFVKLGWALGKTKNNEEIRRLMLENISGEFNERLGEEFI